MRQVVRRMELKQFANTGLSVVAGWRSNASEDAIRGEAAGWMRYLNELRITNDKYRGVLHTKVNENYHWGFTKE